MSPDASRLAFANDATVCDASHIRVPHSPSHLRSSAFIGGCLLTALLTGCSGYAGPRSIVNPDPAVKIPAMRKAVDAKDTSVIPQLIKDLDSGDPAIRFYAIESLQRLTGQSHGYDWTQDDRHARAPAIARWRTAAGIDSPTTQTNQ